MNVNEEIKLKMIDKLQEILKHERKHFNFYLQASLEVGGMERLYLKPLFEKEMAGELEHVRKFGDKIVSLGGRPTQEAHTFVFGSKYVPTASAMLVMAIRMEREILKIYHDLYPEAEKYAEVFGDMSIALLLEENIEHTTEDVEEMEKIAGGIPAVGP